MDPHRGERLAEALREELSELIAYEMSDPRCGDVTGSEVITSPDKRHAQVRIGLTSGGDPKEALEALEHACGFLRHQLAERLDTFRIPELHFEPDVSVTIGPRIGTLLKRVRKGRPRKESGSPAPPNQPSHDERNRDRKEADAPPPPLPDFQTSRLPDFPPKK